MLSLLKIRNLALVDELTWELGPGLVGVTGETGAGKSVIVGALKLVLGERAEKSAIRSGEQSCVVEAVFQVGDEAAVNPILEEGGLEPCEDGQLIVRRVIGHVGNKQFVNDSPVTLALMKRLGEMLVDLHGPHDHQSLHSTERQMTMLDAWSGAEADLGEYRRLFRIWKGKQAELDGLQRADQASERELELLRHQVEEIDNARIIPEDTRDLEERWRRSANAGRLMEVSATASGLLSSDGGVFTQLGDLQRQMRELEKLDPVWQERAGALETAVVELRELDTALANYADELDINPQETAALEERVNLLESLKRKYGPELEDVLEKREEAERLLDCTENRADRIEALEKEIAGLRAKLGKQADVVARLRKKGAPKLAKEISGQLKDLGFQQASFEIALTTLPEPGMSGNEAVEFQFGPNPGEPVLPLRQIASSGEISRVMLAVKSALADQDGTPLMVFDEIDANVGGEIAGAVGRKMAALSARHQVVAITHFPQVAAAATHHFVVEKEVNGGRTRSRLFPVAGESRVREIVRMLGGGGGEARGMAEALLNGRASP
ncbi:MAG: DNA repair protein RecN [Verrucomicrobiota bacterium]